MKKLALLISLLISTNVQSSILNVPANYASIQMALDSSLSGDTVLVAPGTYNENLLWPQLNGIVLMSTGGSANTIISSPVGSNLSVLTFNPTNNLHLDSTNVVQGFQIMNAYIDTLITQGGGIYMKNSSPVFFDLDIHHNTITNGNEGNGGGVFGSFFSNPTFNQCYIHENSVDSCIQSFGGGAAFERSCNVTFIDCRINKNLIHGGFGVGAGLVCEDNCHIQLQHSDIDSNIIDNPLASMLTSGMHVLASTAVLEDVNIRYNFNHSTNCNGPLQFAGSSGTLTRVVISENTARSGNTSYIGGGLNLTGSSNVTVESCEITNNALLDSAGGSQGAGISVDPNTVLNITNSQVTNNRTSYVTNDSLQGGAIYCGNNSLVTIMNCTFSDNGSNDSRVKGGAIYNTGGTVHVTNSILWNPLAPHEIRNFLTPSVTADYSDIRNGYTGVSIIHSDPLFAGVNDYHLTLNSPCVNAGTLTGSPLNDLDNNARPMPVSANPDLGAYEIDESLNTVFKAEGQNLMTVLPNPANDFFEIRLPEEYKENELFIYDSRGLLVLNKTFRGESMMLNTIQYNSGIYFIRIISNGNKTFMNRLIKI